MILKKRYRLMQHTNYEDYLIIDMKLKLETLWHRNLKDCFTSDFPDKFEDFGDDISNSSRKIVVEFEILKTFEEFKEDYPEYFI